ncbi:DUF2599 domain-containing protein [Gordonia hydrophobica]|uniref:DUF2599 domain-containing protein n=1 Tax=Gordonia hydrophobica TaxID=40516 RepID=A0ABZ2U788_9ACTN|nr:DUF2599 domain-containing protein [Gordonia hydrophobica]
MAAAACCAAVLTLVGCSGDGESSGITDYVPAPSSTTATSTTAPSTTSSAASTETTAASSTPVLPPPYIASATWVQTEVGPSLQIAPTRNGRNVSSPTAGDEAWTEVLKLDPSADAPGMKEQFQCHWTFARLVQPDKPTWNLEPDRPVVSPDEMISTRCNPGFAEE